MSLRVDNTDACWAWSPGIESDLPVNLRQQETLYLLKNTSTPFDELRELALLTGIKQEQLTAFTPERLVLHELIVRVTADILVEEGEEEEVLGQRFRQIAQTVQLSYIAPHLPEIESYFSELKFKVERQVKQILQQTLFRPPELKQQKFFSMSLFRQQPKQPALSVEELQFRAITQLRETGLQAKKTYDIALYKSIYVILSALFTANGRIIRDSELLAKLISRQMCNDYGSRMIGQLLDPIIQEAISKEEYRTVQHTEKPLLISLKGASASGKSTLRPMLREVIRERGIENYCYGTISPDIWRRLLLNYDSLGPYYKYAGRLTSNEINIIDGKLDRYIRAKAQQSRSIPHLIVDRFRFDSFNSKKVSDVLHSTYVSYVDTLHMYFIITPPEATVERGWQRGLERGRYKSVEDFLGHSVEAYRGIPKLFFKWIAYDKPLFRFNFMDNSVSKGKLPNTIAWGTQQEMTIIDPIGLINIERYQKINIYAQSETEVYPAAEQLDIIKNCSFLQQCIVMLPKVAFVTNQQNNPYLIIEQTHYQIIDAELFEELKSNPELKDVFQILLCSKKELVTS